MNRDWGMGDEVVFWTEEQNGTGIVDLIDSDIVRIDQGDRTAYVTPSDVCGNLSLLASH
jgi:hypothetical protein